MVLQECQLEWTRNKLKRGCKVELRVMLTISRSIIRTTMFLKLTILTKDGLLPVTVLWLYENIFNLSSMSWLLSILICSKWMTCTQADIWLQYCWSEIKHENNQSIIQKKYQFPFSCRTLYEKPEFIEHLWNDNHGWGNDWCQIYRCVSQRNCCNMWMFTKKYTDFIVFVMWVKEVKFLPLLMVSSSFIDTCRL